MKTISLRTFRASVSILLLNSYMCLGIGHYTADFGSGANSIMGMARMQNGNFVQLFQILNTDNTTDIGLRIVDANMNELRARVYPASGNAFPHALLIDSADDGILVSLYWGTTPYAAVLKFNSDLTPRWANLMRNMLANASNDIRDIIKNKAGEIVGVGDSIFDNTGNSTYAIIKRINNSTGARVFDNSHKHETNNRSSTYNAVLQQADSTYIAVGNHFDTQSQIPCLSIYANNGATLSDNVSYSGFTSSGTLKRNTFKEVLQTSLGTFVLVQIETAASGDRDFGVMRINPVNGNVIWFKRYFTSGIDNGAGMVEAQDGTGDLLIVGNVNPGPLGGDDMFALRIDPNASDPGSIVWARVYGGSGFDAALKKNDVLPLANGEFLIAGHSSSFGSTRGYVVHIDKDGNSSPDTLSCFNENQANFPVSVEARASTASDTAMNAYNRDSFLGGVPNAQVSSSTAETPCVASIDFGDAPSEYGDAMHSIGSLFLGAAIDGEINSIYNAGALGDDSDGTPDDEDGIRFGAQFIPGGTVPISVEASASGILQGWIDWNADGDFNDAGEQIYNDQNLSAGINTLSIAVPSTVAEGVVYARFRLSSQAGLGTTGLANDGEVEDYAIQISPFKLSCKAGNVEKFDINQVDFSGTPLGTKNTSLYIQPAVGDVDGDGQVEIVAVGEDAYCLSSLCAQTNINIFNAQDGSQEGSINLPFYTGFNTPGCLGIADIDNDGQAEIVVAGADGTWKGLAHNTGGANGSDYAGGDARNYLFAYELDGTPIWLNASNPSGKSEIPAYSVAFADFNADGRVEIYNNQAHVENGIPPGAGGIIDGLTGKSLVSGEYNGVAVDIDEDGQLELVSFDTVYEVQIDTNSFTGSINPGVKLNDPAITSLTHFKQETLIADMDLDGDLDVIAIKPQGASVGRLFIWEGQSDTLLAFIDYSIVSFSMGRPTIADIDGDGTPEIIANSSERLYAFEYNTGELSKKWSMLHSDTSGGTGITAFDFNNDGVEELVYRDETRLRIIDGNFNSPVDVSLESRSKGTFVNTSTTGQEYPLIADIDNDGEAEVIIQGDTVDRNPWDPPIIVSAPIQIYESGDIPWAYASPVWNQYSFYNAHINDDLSVPAVQKQHWKEVKLPDGSVVYPNNAYLQKNNVQLQACDWGDVPSNYPTLYADDGPRHIATTNTLYIGTLIDSETNGMPSALADGDDTSNTDDEEGVTFGDLVTFSSSYSANVKVKNSSGSAATLHGWIDFDLNGSFEASEYTSQTILNGMDGTVNLSWTGYTVGGTNTNTYARLRLSTDPDITSATPGGQADDGEVEDYRIWIPFGVDFGDAPASYGTSNTSHSVASNLFLGSEVDAEGAALLSVGANGDDTNGTPDDEDGVNLSSICACPGSTISVPVKVFNNTGANVSLGGWIDFDNNGDFERSEGVVMGVNSSDSEATVTLDIPNTVCVSSAQVYARFRLSSEVLISI